MTIEQIHFYRSRFGEQPAGKKSRATPSVSVSLSLQQFLGVTSSDVSEETRKQMKQNLKMEIIAANNYKFMPPVYYLLTS